jgi:hypothetical protein
LTEKEVEHHNYVTINGEEPKPSTGFFQSKQFTYLGVLAAIGTFALMFWWLVVPVLH